MKYLKCKYVCWAIACFIVVSLAACSDDEPSEFRQKFYLTTGVNPFNSEKVNIWNNLFSKEITTDCAYEYLLTARSTMPAGHDTKVMIEADEQAVKTYNEANGTKYMMLPKSQFEVKKNSATISRDSYSSSDKLIINIKEISSELTEPNGYILPLRLSGLEGGSMNDASNNRNMIYILFEVHLTYDGILEAKGSEPLAGTAIDRRLWKSKTETKPYSSGYSLQYLFDNDAKTCFFFHVDYATNIDTDLNNEEMIKGISLTAGYGVNGYYNYALRSLNLAVSRDGSSWYSLGSVNISRPENGASTADNPFINYIAFKEPIPAHHVRMLPTATWGGYVNLSELNVYK